MDIEIIEMADRKAKFVLRNSSPAMANALRRTLLSDIPKMAIDSVEFYTGKIEGDDGKEYESITPLFEEIIAHRMGMLPVPTDLDLFVPKSECECGGEGCPSCTIIYSLKKTGPATVLSSDLQPLGPNPEKLRIVDEFIPIVELTADQGITVYAKAVMGTAKKHVKWQVCNGVGYKYMPVIEIDPKHAADLQVVKCAELCPAGLEVKGKKLVVKDPVACGYARGCLEKLDETEGITVNWDDSNFLFKYETDGSLTAQQALDIALEVLSKEAKDFAGDIAAL
ncbi:MAG: DNA-directed RNA polymerase subunit D [Thermoplasmata archaeon]|nr:DNA-directed RNA polymerase subunit D [Thermoplasmata archaeon]